MINAVHVIIELIQNNKHLNAKLSTIDFDTDNPANIKVQRHVTIIYMYISMCSRVHINTYCVHKHDIDIDSIYECKRR